VFLRIKSVIKNNGKHEWWRLYEYCDDKLFEEMEVDNIIEKIGGKSDEDGPYYPMTVTSLVTVVRILQTLMKKL